MKAMDIIERLDLLEPNDYSTEQKLRWLSSLDGRIYREIMQNHMDLWQPCPAPCESGEEELLVPAPYGEDLYYYYLQAMVAAENGETQRYNKRITLFNAAYQGWANWYNRSHRPRRRGAGFRF